MIVTYNNEQMTAGEAVRRSGTAIPKKTVICRLNKGWPLQLALFRPLAQKGNRRGSIVSSREWGKV